MITQYPDSIVISVSNPATQDTTGNWIPSYNIGYTFNCRAEPNSSGRRIAGKDGIMLDYTMICYMPLDGLVDMVMTTEDGDIITTDDGSPILIGTVVSSLMYGSEATYSLTNRLGETTTGTVKRSFNGQLNARIWL